MSITELMVSGVKRGGIAVLDALLPPQCLSCRAIVDQPGRLCAECWRGMTFIAPPWCECCGLPFAVQAGPGMLCGDCIAGPRAFRHARAVLRYDDASRGPILAFKHGDRTDAAPAFARWILPVLGPLLDEADLVAAVPLHRWRLWRRRYNQAALLAQWLGRHGGREVVPDLLVRRRATPPQGHLSRAERARNVAGAFRVADRHRARVKGRRILLVDDVFTTGATVEACCRALRKAGASHVDVACLARVVRSL